MALSPSGSTAGGAFRHSSGGTIDAVRTRAPLPPIAKTFVVALVAASLALIPANCAGAAGTIVVASKIDTEGALLGQMIAALLEARGLAVEKKIQLGPTNIVRAAILAGQIDIYPEYTGNGAVFFHREADPVWKHDEAGHGLGFYV